MPEVVILLGTSSSSSPSRVLIVLDDVVVAAVDVTVCWYSLVFFDFSKYSSSIVVSLVISSLVLTVAAAGAEKVGDGDGCVTVDVVAVAANAVY